MTSSGRPPRSPHRAHRARWAAIGAAVAVTLGAGGLATVDATSSSGERTVFVPVTPCRLVDTRPTSTVGNRSRPLGADDTHVVAARGERGECDLPADASALALNVTAVGASAPTFLTVFPDGADRPDASNLNPQPGDGPTPNSVTTDLSGAGRFSIYNRQGVVDVIVDVTGYYVDHDHDDRYYTQAEVDSLIASATPSPVVMSQGFDWVSNGGNPSTVAVFENTTLITGGLGGTAHLSLTGPAMIGGNAYLLASVRYCVSDTTGTVAEISIIGLGNEIPGDPGELAIETKDTTDRATAGCFTIVADPEVGSRSAHHLMLFAIGDVQVAEVTATWTAA